MNRLHWLLTALIRIIIFSINWKYVERKARELEESRAKKDFGSYNKSYGK